MVKQPRKKAAGERDEGHQVKPAKKRTAPTNTSLLPPCKVCQEPAAGFHYGANTCEACKGFFRRTLVREGDYECVNGDEKCTVVLAELKGKKRICSRCRHLKCLAVGMSLQAVKTGRYTHAKRTQDILEYKQVMGRTDDSDLCFPVSSAATPSPPMSNTTSCFSAMSVSSVSAMSSSMPDNASITTAILSSVSQANSPESASSSFHVGAAGCGPVPTHSLTLPSQDNEAAPQYTALKPAQLPCLQNTSFWYQSHAGTSHFEGDPVSSTLSPPRLQSLLTSSSVGNVMDHMMDVEPGRNDCEISVSSKDSSASSPPSVSPWDSMASPCVDGSSGDMSDEECQRLTEHILQSYAANNFAKYTLSAEEMMEKQRACYENFQARIEVFGPMENLTGKEYMDVYESTGIDVDNRQTFISTVSKVMEESIHEYIRFAKTIPGFSQLCMKDKITLIRDNRAEVMAIAQTTGYNHQLQVFTLPSGRTFSMHDMAKIGGKERQKVRCDCLHAIQCLGLTLEERVLFKCMVLFTVGRDDVEDPERVSIIQWKMVQCLRWLLRRNKRASPDIVLARIIAVFGRLREFAMVFYEWMKSKPFAHYAQFKQNELLAEWFSNT